MSAPVRSLRSFGFTPLAVLTLTFAACATAQEPDIEPFSGGNTPATGGSSAGGSGAGGVKTGTGGSLPFAPTAGTTGMASGGHVGSGGTGVGPATGGMPAASGGMPAATGGSSSTSTCPQYAGTLAKDSVIFSGGFGTSTAGTTKWSGYGYTYKYGTATITPGMGNNCFANKQMCANGSVPADDASGAGLGWNISQMSGASTTAKVAITTPVVVKFAGGKEGMRVQLSPSSSADAFCYILTAAEATAGTATIPLKSFKTKCYDTATAVAYAGTPIEAIQVAVPGAMAAAKPFDFCLLDIEPGAATP